MWKEFKNNNNKIEFINMGEGHLLKISQGKTDNEWYCVPVQNPDTTTFKIVATVDELRIKLNNNDI